MIDELDKIADAMEKAGIIPVNWHPSLHILPKVTGKNSVYASVAAD